MSDRSVYIVSIIKYIDQLKCFKAFSKWALAGANFYFVRDENDNCEVYRRSTYCIPACNWKDDSNYLTLSDLSTFTNFRRRDQVYLSSSQWKVYQELTEQEYFSDESSDEE